MKILWFTNTPCSASEMLQVGSHRGGWLKGWEAELVKHEEVELCIAFYHNKNIEPFTYKKTHYYPVFRKNTGSKIGRWINRIAGKTTHDKKEVRQLLDVINTVKPDLLHVHGTEDNFGLAASLTSVPAIIGIQGLLTPYAAKYFSGVPAAMASANESVIETILVKSARQLFKDHQRRALRERQIMANSRHVIGRTNWDNRVARILAPQAQYHYCDDILRAGFYNHTWQKKEFNRKVRIVSVSSEALYKGFETIVETASLLAARKDFDFEWIVAGLDERNGSVKIVRSWLGKDLNQLSIQLVGNRGEEEIIRILLESDIYCQVSHIENSPNSLCEAMLLGMPVIASYAGGTGSLVTDREDGLLVQDGDSCAFAGAILEMAGNFAQAKEYARKAGIRAKEHHDRQRIGNDLVRIYSTVLNKKP